LTENNTGVILNLAINYGGRAELVDAFKKMIANPQKEITEETISQNLYTAGLPDPDLIIRTSGEQRLSGFLTWQSVYSELLFINRYWPEFSKEDFETALAEFANCQRRFGK
jgi:undecaprenyl diphosphate synthase